MYTEFYNLRDKPFNLTPSSRSLYLGDIHKEALALLTYGVLDRKGFILLTGEVGTGKTTMVHALLTNLGRDIEYVYLSNPLFAVNDFMNYLAFSAFKEKRDIKNKTDFLIQFKAFLEKQLRERKNFILIIDEAQKLSFELLEEMRLLSNLETSEEKLLNIFLVGQPELNELLIQPRCRPLLQRISTRYHIRALDESGSLEYISTRLKLAGAENPDKVIPRNVARTIFRYSDGYPRMINILADNVLLFGYSRGVRNITPAMVKECYDDLQLEGSFFDAGRSKVKPENRRKGFFGMLRDFKWAAL
jgi:general secretion pathway protein A